MKHEYTAEQALRRLIEKLNGRAAELAAQVLAWPALSCWVAELDRLRARINALEAKLSS